MKFLEALFKNGQTPNWFTGFNYLTVMGSRAYKTSVPESDYDFVGFLVPPLSVVFPHTKGTIAGFGKSIQNFEQIQFQHVQTEEYGEVDVTLYGIVKYFQLLMGGNPNIVDSIFTSEDSIYHTDEVGKLVKENRHLFLSEKNFHTFRGMLHAHLSRIKSGHIKEGRKINSEKHEYDCYAEETEFLTKSGWKKYENISDGEEVGTINKNTKSLEFQVPEKRFKYKIKSDYLYSYRNIATQFMVTKNHSLFVSDCHRSEKNNFSLSYSKDMANWKLETIGEMLDNRRQYFHVLHFPTNNNKDFDISDEYLILLGLFISEGHYIKNKKKEKIGLSISQMERNNKILPFISRIFKRYKVREYFHNRNEKGREISYHINDLNLTRKIMNDCGEYARNKKLPSWILNLSKRQGRLLLDSLMSGDGTYEDYSGVYYTISERLADDIQTLSMISEYYSKIWKYDYTETIQICISDFHGQFGFIDKNKFKKIIYENKSVVCFEVENSILVTRINGETAFHGNSKDGYHCMRMCYELDEILFEGTLTIDKNSDELMRVRRGEILKNELVEYCENYLVNIEDKVKNKKSLLKVPHSPDESKIKKVLLDCLDIQYGTGWKGNIGFDIKLQ